MNAVLNLTLLRGEKMARKLYTQRPGEETNAVGLNDILETQRNMSTLICRISEILITHEATHAPCA